MLEVVIGGLVDPPPAKTRYTFCADGAEETGLGFDLTPEGVVVATAVFQRMNQPVPALRHTQDLASCSAPLCWLFRFVDFSNLQTGEGVWRFKAPTIDPVQLTLGLALAFKLNKELGGGWAVEIYSDMWTQFSDLLAMARGLRGVLRIYTSVFDSRIMVADRAVMAAPGVTFEALSLKKEWSGGRLCPVEAAEPAEEVEPEVKEFLQVVYEAGGFVTLKYAVEHFGRDVVMKAVKAGYLELDSFNSTLKLTERGMSAL
jgi:hypothetical protein